MMVEKKGGWTAARLVYLTAGRTARKKVAPSVYCTAASSVDRKAGRKA